MRTIADSSILREKIFLPQEVELQIVSLKTLKGLLFIGEIINRNLIPYT